LSATSQPMYRHGLRFR